MPRNKALPGSQGVHAPLLCAAALQLGVFVGDSLQELAPLEEARPAVEGAGAWPAANPVTLAGGTLKLAAPSLLATDERLYAFYEDGAGCGRLAAAESIDAGLTWRPWGALQLAGAEQPLSGPFVFRHMAEVGPGWARFWSDAASPFCDGPGRTCAALLFLSTSQPLLRRSTWRPPQQARSASSARPSSRRPGRLCGRWWRHLCALYL